MLGTVGKIYCGCYLWRAVAAYKLGVKVNSKAECLEERKFDRLALLVMKAVRRQHTSSVFTVHEQSQWLL